jgi:hypothetical protein
MKADILLQDVLLDGRVSHHRYVAIPILDQFDGELQLDQVDLFDSQLHDVLAAGKLNLDILLLPGGRELNLAEDLLFRNEGQFRNILPLLLFGDLLLLPFLLQQFVDV